MLLHVNGLRQAGWEGVMIHCGHGWLPAQFLSPQYNKRTDEEWWIFLKTEQDLLLIC